MKLIFAGALSSYSLNPENFLFNCTRNKQCQRKYFVPVRGIEDLDFYADLPGKPDLVDIKIIDLCCTDVLESDGDFNDDFNDDFDTGNDTLFNCPTTHYFDRYVVGQTPQNTWYGVFSSTIPLPPGIRMFYLKFTFTINGQEYIFYSEQIEVEICAPVTCIRGCYPNEPIGSDAYDCNGIYYGFPSGEEPVLGEKNYRYFHKACIRFSAIIEHSAKLTFSIFNNKRTYKSKMHRETLFEFELVPAFYKNHLLGIFARGNVQIEGREYLLQEEQTWQVLDLDSKLWRVDVLMTEDCTSLFGCAPADCSLPIPVCENNVAFGEWEMADGSYVQHFGGDINLGDKVEWEIRDRQGVVVLYSGVIDSPPLDFTQEGVDPYTNCYLLRWRVVCQVGAPTDYKEQEFGNCDEADPIEGLLSIYALGISHQQCTAQAVLKIRLRFTNPLPEDITINFAMLSFPDNGSNSYQAVGGNIIPALHPDKSIFNTWGSASTGHAITDEPYSYVIPAGTTDWNTDRVERDLPGFPGVKDQVNTFPVCNPVWGANRRHRFYFTVTPDNYRLNFGVIYDTPAPENTIPGGIQAVQQIV